MFSVPVAFVKLAGDPMSALEQHSQFKTCPIRSFNYLLEISNTPVLFVERGGSSRSCEDR